MIPVYQPWLTDLEKRYVNEALDAGWISSAGKFIDKSEELFAQFVGTKYALVCSNGTTALHLCYRALDKSDPLPRIHQLYANNHDVVVMPNITFVATAAAARFDERQIIFADVDLETWNLDLKAVEAICEKYQVTTVVPVHLYGNPVDMVGLKELQKTYGFRILEDACESLGGEINGVRTGNLSDIACFSFFGNKSLTCGEGGAITTNDEALYNKAKLLRGQAQDFKKRYWHVDVGYNYRLTNIQAAILCAQLERALEILAEKQRVFERYYANLKDHVKFQKVLPGHKHSNWLVTVTLPCPYEPIAKAMADKGIDTRKIFYPVSDMPPYQDDLYWIKPDWPLSATANSNSHSLSAYGLSLPSYPQLTNDQIDTISESLKTAISQ